MQAMPENAKLLHVSLPVNTIIMVFFDGNTLPYLTQCTTLEYYREKR
jgi:hypothetical protein